MMQKHGRGKCDQGPLSGKPTPGAGITHTQESTYHLFGSGSYRVTPPAAWGG